VFLAFGRVAFAACVCGGFSNEEKPMSSSDVPAAVLLELVDHHEIRKLIAIYAHGCDRGDGDMMASVYATPSRDAHGLFGGDGKDFTAMVMQQIVTHNITFFHTIGQSLIKVSGDAAGAETYFIASGRLTPEAAPEVVNLMGGRYVDQLVREKGQWKVKERICVRDWSISLDAKRDWLEGFVQGQMSGDDPSYSVLGLRHSGLTR
jgi:SnoaL-like domain